MTTILTPKAAAEVLGISLEELSCMVRRNQIRPVRSFTLGEIYRARERLREVRTNQDQLDEIAGRHHGRAQE